MISEIWQRNINVPKLDNDVCSVLILDNFERGTVASSCFIKGSVHRKCRKSDKRFPMANVELHRENHNDEKLRVSLPDV